MTRPLRVGIQLPEVEREVRWPEIVDLARTIEDAGFDAIWVGEHLLYRWPNRPARGPWEAWTLMAALAAETSRATIGPLVACAGGPSLRRARGARFPGRRPGGVVSVALACAELHRRARRLAMRDVPKPAEVPACRRPGRARRTTSSIS